MAKALSPEHRLYKICNKNVIKLSYSCAPNMASVITAHIKKLLMSMMTSRRLCLVIAKIRSSARFPVEGLRNALSTKSAWIVAVKPWITLVCARSNSKHATTITCSRSDTKRRARRLNFRNTSGHARTLVRILSSHEKSSVRLNHTAMEVDNAIFVSQKNILS